MSGYARNAISHHGLLDIGVHLLPKPFTVEHLARKLREVLSTRDRRPVPLGDRRAKRATCS
jgi:hypothetical protein